jgi:hypothetical protein
MILIKSAAESLQETGLEVDRRTGRRYPIKQLVHYKLLCGRNISTLGEGRTVDMSSKGVSFTTPSDLPLGAGVELTVEWPALLYGSIRIKLMLFGVVMGGREHVVSMRVLRHEFRTQANRA